MVLSDYQELSAICKSWGIRDPELFASVQVRRGKSLQARVATLARAELC